MSSRRPTQMVGVPAPTAIGQNWLERLARAKATAPASHELSHLPESGRVPDIGAGPVEDAFFALPHDLQTAWWSNNARAWDALPQQNKDAQREGRLKIFATAVELYTIAKAEGNPNLEGEAQRLLAASYDDAHAALESAAYWARIRPQMWSTTGSAMRESRREPLPEGATYDQRMSHAFGTSPSPSWPD
jgi:hypothetical protein